MQEEGHPRRQHLTLLDRIRAHDGDALADVDRRYRARLTAALQRLGRDLALAEDAAQEALLALWRTPPADREDGSVYAWLLVSARHALFRRLRKDSALRLDDPLDPVAALGVDAGWGQPTLGQRAEAALASRECLERAFATLAPDDRELLALIDIEGLTLLEAAAALTLTLPALKSRLHRARLKLIASLTREDCHDPA